jgi:hypothetical protein
MGVYCFSVYPDDKIATLSPPAASPAPSGPQPGLSSSIAPLPAPLPAPAPVPGPTGNVIESRIDGDFNGWDGETVFALQNGQIWRQAAYDYYYQYAYNPSVLIYPASDGRRMKVDGADRTIPVERLQ